MCIHGNGASISVLMEAGARDADLVIAVTGVDETNLVCALIAKSVGAQRDVAAYMKKQKKEAEEPVNNAFAAALKGIKL